MLRGPSCAATFVALYCNFEIAACCQFVEVMARNVGVHFKLFCYLSSGDTLLGFARKQIHGTTSWIAECRCDGGHGGGE
jgi:hypothetical protein